MLDDVPVAVQLIGCEADIPFHLVCIVVQTSFIKVEMLIFYPIKLENPELCNVDLGYVFSAGPSNFSCIFQSKGIHHTV